MQQLTKDNKIIPTDSTLVYCDLETSDLRANVLLQIACNSKNKDLNLSCSPTGYLSPFCTNLAGLYSSNRNLYKKGRKLSTFTVEQALFKFKQFIESYDTPVTLVCFNNFGFDAKVLVRHFLQKSVPLPSNLTHFADPLPAFKRLLKTEKLTNFKLGTLCTHFDVSLIEAHDAKFDSLSLQVLCEKVSEQRNLTVVDFLDKYVKPVDHFIKQQTQK